MAKIATVTKTTYRIITEKVCMNNPNLVGLSSVRNNIRYAVEPYFELDNLHSRPEPNVPALF